jgi:hypothetical protein
MPQEIDAILQKIENHSQALARIEQMLKALQEGLKQNVGAGAERVTFDREKVGAGMTTQPQRGGKESSPSSIPMVDMAIPKQDLEMARKLTQFCSQSLDAIKALTESVVHQGKPPDLLNKLGQDLKVYSNQDETSLARKGYTYLEREYSKLKGVRETLEDLITEDVKVAEDIQAQQ